MSLRSSGLHLLMRPAVLRQVDRIAVRIVHPVFGLAVRRPLGRVGRRAPLLAARDQVSDAVDLEAEMIDALLELVALDQALRPDRNDRQIDVAVGQVGRGADALDDREPERVGVKLDHAVDVFGQDGEVADAGHGSLRCEAALSLPRILFALNPGYAPWSLPTDKRRPPCAGCTSLSSPCSSPSF